MIGLHCSGSVLLSCLIITFRFREILITWYTHKDNIIIELVTKPRLGNFVKVVMLYQPIGLLVIQGLYTNFNLW